MLKRTSASYRPAVAGMALSAALAALLLLSCNRTDSPDDAVPQWTNRILKNPADLADPSKLPSTSAASFTVFAANDEWPVVSAPSITGLGDTLWVMWAASKTGVDERDQSIFISSSTDGHRWSAPSLVAGDPDGPKGPLRWLPAGLSGRGGELVALATYAGNLESGQQAKGMPVDPLKLFRFEKTGDGWKSLGVLVDDCLSTEAPHQLGTRLAVICRDLKGDAKLASADLTDELSWTVVPLYPQPPYNRLLGATWYQTDDGLVHAFECDPDRSGHLLAAASQDGGVSWSSPEWTNYPDTNRGLAAGRLRQRWYYLVNIPFQDGPVVAAFSADGRTFSRLRAVTDSGAAAGSDGFSHPRATNWNNSLWVVYAVGSREIRISETPFESLGLKDLRFSVE